MRELSRIEGLRPGDPISQSARLAEYAGGFDELTRAVEDNPPVFVQNIYPVQGATNAELRESIDRTIRTAAYQRRQTEQVNGIICRSEFKLIEAIEAFNVPIAKDKAAVDFGAAPGGWTRILRSRGMKVTAIDPADLDPRVANDPGVTHLRATAGSFLKTAEDGMAALLVNDMKMEPDRSIALMVESARILSPNGFAVATLKLPAGAVNNWPSIINQAKRTATGAYSIAGIRQLPHNRNEVTCVMRRI